METTPKFIRCQGFTTKKERCGNNTKKWSGDKYCRHHIAQESAQGPQPVDVVNPCRGKKKGGGACGNRLKGGRMYCHHHIDQQPGQPGFAPPVDVQNALPLALVSDSPTATAPPPVRDSPTANASFPVSPAENGRSGVPETTARANAIDSMYTPPAFSSGRNNKRRRNDDREHQIEMYNFGQGEFGRQPNWVVV
jgi:hypothetical protein